MERTIQHQVLYELPGAPSIADVVESLLGIERLLLETGPVMESCIPGLKIERIGITVRELSEGSLKEIVWAAIYLTFQKDLEAEVPAAIEQLTGVHIPDQFDTIVTVLFCVLAFYGVHLIYDQISGSVPGNRVRAQFDGLVRDAARSMGTTEEDLRGVLEERYAKSRSKLLKEAAARFFSPSKRQKDAPILIGRTRIESDVLAEIPLDPTVTDLAPDEISRQHLGVEIELHAQDVDHTKRGWAAVAPSVSQDRLRLEIYPPIKPEQIYTRSKIKGDLIVVSRRQDDGSYKPSMLHLIRLDE